MNLILIGMPGSGKSTLGKAMAEALSMPFLDTDTLIEQTHKTTLAHLIQTHGLQGFVELESAAIHTLNPQNTLIATGGSVPLNAPAMAHLKTLGKIIFLDVPLPELTTRLGNLQTRGVVGAGEMSLAQIHAHRHPIYQTYADITLTGTLTPAEALQTLRQYL